MPFDNSHLKQYVDYINNTKRVPLRIDWFDEDHEPVGPIVRADMVEAGLITEAHDGICLTEAGHALGK